MLRNGMFIENGQNRPPKKIFSSDQATKLVFTALLNDSANRALHSGILHTVHIHGRHSSEFIMFFLKIIFDAMEMRFQSCCFICLMPHALETGFMTTLAYKL